MSDVAKEIVDKALEAIELSRENGKIKKGANEVTKMIERGTAKLVAYAGNVTPQEIVMHLEALCKEKGIPCIKIPTKEELGTASGISVTTTAVAIIEDGNAKALIEEIKKTLESE